MDENDWLAGRFEEHRTGLRALAYRMLGSTAEADNAVQEAWPRLARSDTSDVENLGGWLTVPASTASLLIATIPAFTALWVVAFLKEQLAAVGWAGVAVSFLGVAAIGRETRAKEERPPTTHRVGAGEKGARGR